MMHTSSARRLLGNEPSIRRVAVFAGGRIAGTHVVRHRRRKIGGHVALGASLIDARVIECQWNPIIGSVTITADHRDARRRMIGHGCFLVILQVADDALRADARVAE